MLQRIELGFVLRGYMKLQEQGGQEPRNLSSNLVTLGKSWNLEPQFLFCKAKDWANSKRVIADSKMAGS